MDFKQKQKFILEGNMSKVIIILAAPIMFNNLIQTLYNLADTYWVSKLGTTSMAAMTLVFPVVFLSLSIGMGINVAGTALISQYIGANKESEGKKIASQMVTFAFTLAIILTLLGYLTTPFIVRAMGGEGEVFTQGTDYLSIMFWEMPSMFLILVYTAIKQAQGDTFTPMVLNVAGVILNIILDPIFIFVLDFGIKGAALATVFSRTIFALYSIYTLFIKKEGIFLEKSNLKLDIRRLEEILRISVPASLGRSASALGFIILNTFIISYGEDTLAAFGIGNRINSLILMPAQGIGMALATIIGQNIGAYKKDRVKLAFTTSIKLTTTFMAIGGIVIFSLSQNIISIFVQGDLEVLNQATKYLKLVSASLPLMGFFQIFIGTFQGAGHTVYAMIMEMGRLWALRIPMIILFGKLTTWGSDGVWYAMVLSNLFICIYGLIIYLSGKWRKEVIKVKALSE